MPQLDFSTFSSQVFWLIISFALMLTIMRFLVVPRISSIIDQRNRHIENYIRKAEKLQEQALSSLNKYNAAIEQAKFLAEGKSKEAEAELTEFIKNKSEETLSALNEKICESEQILNEQRCLALEEASNAAADLSLIILKKIGLDDLAYNETKAVDDGR